MKKRDILVVLSIGIFLALGVSGIYALSLGNDVNVNIGINNSENKSADVAYLYKSEKLIDNNIVKLFNNSGLIVEFVNEKDFEKKLTGGNYNVIFVGDERFYKNIPIEKYNSIITNYYLGGELGITDRDGVSKLSSREPLNVNFKGDYLQVYTSAIDSNRNYLNYYYLDKNNKVKTLMRYAGTYSSGSGSNFGDVISFIEKGKILGNGKTSEGRVCFYGIVQSDYWTENAKRLFDDCLAFSSESQDSEVIICSANLECNDGINKTNDICINPGTTSSFCSNEEFECVNDLSCNDNNPNTRDSCVANSCSYEIIEEVSIEDVKESSTANSITINFSVINPGNLSIKNIIIKKNNDSSISLSGSSRNYVFNNLKPSTNYTISVKSKDSLDRESDEVVLVVSTKAVVINGNSSSGNSTSGSNSSSGNSSSGNSTSGSNGSGNQTNNNSSSGNTGNSSSGNNSSSGGSNGNSSSGNSTSGNQTNNNSSSGNTGNSSNGNNSSSSGSNGNNGGSSSGGGSVSTTTTSQPSVSLSPGFSFCSTLWECSEWESCINGQQTRTCTWDQTKCKPEEALRPKERQACTDDGNGGGSSDEEDVGAQEPSGGNLALTGAAIRDLAGKPATWIVIILLIGIIVGSVYYYNKNKSSVPEVKAKIVKAK